MMNSRYALRDASELLSPGLLIYRNLVRQNLQDMIAMARGADRLRPHVKTHKMAEIVRMAESMGIRKHKCATIAEAEMVAAAGGTDILLSYPLVGPNLKRFAHLVRGYRHTLFRATVDHPDSARRYRTPSRGSTARSRSCSTWRSGWAGPVSNRARRPPSSMRWFDRLPHLVADGLHAYDGQVHDSDREERRRSAQPGMERTLALRDRLLKRGMAVPRMVVGGTPTFPIHAELDIPGIECSPGTCVLNDHGYSTRYPDLAFTPAALLLTRVVSHPQPGRVCLDLGHKAVAADPGGTRFRLLDLDDARPVVHSEEHLVIETSQADALPIGTTILAMPTHICPTVALHRRAYVIEDGQLVDQWEVTARDRVLGI